MTLSAYRLLLDNLTFTELFSLPPGWIILEILRSDYGKTKVNRRAFTKWRAARCYVKLAAAHQDDFKTSFHSAEVRVSNWDSYRCFFALDSSKTASGSHVAIAAFVESFLSPL